MFTSSGHRQHWLSSPGELPGSKMACGVYRLPHPPPQFKHSRACPSTPATLTSSCLTDKPIGIAGQSRVPFKSSIFQQEIWSFWHHGRHAESNSCRGNLQTGLENTICLIFLILSIYIGSPWPKFYTNHIQLETLHRKL